MIEVNHLTKKYGSHFAVNDLSFTVEKGQIYGFLGPNGAGKSTTMNIITGYLAATSGTVTINGFDIMKQPEEAKKCVGYLPELPPLYQDMTVNEYLKFSAQLKKVKKEEQGKQIQEIMDATHIAEMKGRLIKNLSKGYKQRVGLAQAMIGYPEIIILDEPTVGLDPKQIIEIRDLIKGLKERHTIILSSHILSEVSAVCDHILIISNGKLVASDSPDNLSNRMNGEGELELEVKGNKEKLEGILKQLPSILSYDFEEEKDVIKAKLKVGTEEDIREPLFYLLAREKMPIMKMVLSTSSLEDIFLKLTDADSQQEQQEQQEQQQNGESTIENSEQSEQTEDIEESSQEEK